MREEFKWALKFQINVSSVVKFIGDSDNGKPWFTCVGFTSHIYPQDVLKCLNLVGIDQGLAQSAVDDMFELQNLTPLYNILCDDPSEMLGPEI